MADDFKSIIVAVICIVTSAFISGAFMYNQVHLMQRSFLANQSATVTPTVGTSSPTPEKIKPESSKKTHTTNSALDSATDNSQVQAKTILENFFTFANEKNYEKAADMLGWDNMETADLNQWPGSTYAKTLQNYCQAVGTCLKVRNAIGEKISDNEYHFTVSFLTDNNEVFAVNPPGGMTGTPATNFIFKVKKINGSFKLVTPPVFRS